MRNKIINKTVLVSGILIFLLVPIFYTLAVLNFDKLSCILLALWIWDVGICGVAIVLSFYFDTFE